MSLLQLAQQYAACHDISAGHAEQMKRHARLYGAGFSAAELNADLQRLRRAGRSDSYVRNRKQYVLLLWRFAASRDLVPDPPLSKLMRVRISDTVPRGFEACDVAALIAQARLLKGTYASGIARSAWWQSYLAGAWETGLSACDMLAVERHWIRSDGSLRTVRHKTGRRVEVAFTEETLRLIDATFPPERRLVWPLTISREAMRVTFRKLTRAAGTGGSLKWLRAGSGTSVEELHGRGEQHLGNTRQVFERHYLCRTAGARLPASVW